MTLYLVATPIGNLSDMTYRAIDTLKLVDYILCEDTRHSLTLLQQYSISKPLKSYHKFSESSQLISIIDDLKAGKNIALISDAGTPGISDPGQKLVMACRQAALPVYSIPGACAAVAALSCSGLDTDQFQFIGFLPKKINALKDALKNILAYTGTTICYESPKRILDVLETLHEIAPDRRIAICRELTKKFEEFQWGTAQELLGHWKDREVKGEIVFMISGRPIEDNQSQWKDLSPEQHVQMMMDMYHLTKNEAIKMVAQLRGVPKRDIYNVLHNKTEED